MAPEKETDARILIDALLREAGWNPADKAQVRTEVYAVAAETGRDSSVVREEPPCTSAGPGRCDYVLHDTNGQRRIVDLLEASDTLCRQRAEADTLATRILPALFRKMFGDPSRNECEWPTVPLGNFLEAIDSGWSPTCENRTAHPGEWGVLKLGAVTGNHYRDTENKALPSTLEPQLHLEVNLAGHFKVYHLWSNQSVPPRGCCFLTGWMGCLQGGISDYRRSRFAAAGC